MILSLPPPTTRTLPRKLHWKQEIRHNLYVRNQEMLKNQPVEMRKQESGRRRRAEKALLALLEGGIETMRAKDNQRLSSCHSYYSFFVPLALQTKLENELTLAFPCLRRLEEAGRHQERRLLMIEISEYMRACAARGEADRGWEQCLQKYVCELDSLRALEVFLEVKKRGGVRTSTQLHRQFASESMPLIFFQRIQWCREYLQLPRLLPAVQALEGGEVSEASMAMTMKNLFCWICLVYDCSQHPEQEALKERDYHFAAPANLIPQQEHIAKATTLYVQYQYLMREGGIPKDGDGPCSSKCYRYLTAASWEELQGRRGVLLSPIVKSVVKMGIHMYSYSPCRLWFLLADRGITCALAFLFLHQDLNLAGRLERRLLGSQAEALLLVGKEEDEEGRWQGRGRGRGRGGRQRVRLAHNEHSYEIAACVHYFFGEGVIDRGCEGCGCRKRNFCLPQCLCDASCPLRKRGCHCRKEDCRTDKCPCRRNNEECDPQLCLSCFSRTECRNHQVLEGRNKRVRVGRSSIGEAGLGLFAGEAVRAGELLTTYSGELIEDSVDILREHLSVDSTFYNFSCREGTIDARFRGNSARFINHDDQGRDNLYAQDVLSGGRFKVALFAKRDIEPDEELFFDYDGEGKLYEFYKEKYPFIHKKKNRGK